MRFLFNGGGYMELLDTIEKNGHTIIRGVKPWVQFAADKKRWHAYNTEILKKTVTDTKPDVYICSKGFKKGLFIYPEVTEWIKKRVQTTIYWSQDDPFFMTTFLNNHMYRGYDVALTCSTASFKQYRSVGIKPYLFWPAWDNMARKIRPTEEKNKVDLIFVGTPYACTDIPRKDLVLWAIRLGWSVEVYGSKSWIDGRGQRGRGRLFIQGDPVIAPYYKGEFRNWRELHNLFLRARITISNHVVRAPMYLNDRVSLVMGAGGCLVLDKNPGIDKVFVHNKEVIFYEDFNTFKHRARYYVARPKMRNVIGRNARRKTLREHTYKQRAEQLLKIVG